MFGSEIKYSIGKFWIWLITIIVIIIVVILFLIGSDSKYFDMNFECKHDNPYAVANVQVIMQVSPTARLSIPKFHIIKTDQNNNVLEQNISFLTYIKLQSLYIVREKYRDNDTAAFVQADNDLYDYVDKSINVK